MVARQPGTEADFCYMDPGDDAAAQPELSGAAEGARFEGIEDDTD